MFSENFHDWQDFYTITGRICRAKYLPCADHDYDDDHDSNDDDETLSLL